MFIYKITNKLNNDFYIGKTTKLIEERLRWHIKYSRRPNAQTHIARAIRMYGENKFYVELVEEVEHDIDLREQYWIKHLKPQYNMTAGGEGGSTTHSRIWVTNGVDNKYIYNWDQIPEGYARGRMCKFRDVNFQKEMSKRAHLSENYKAAMKNNGAKICAARKKKHWGVSGDKNPAKRPEVRKKISEARSKQVVIKGMVFKSCGEAANHFSVCRGTITRWLKNG